MTTRSKRSLGARGRGAHGYNASLNQYLETALWSSTDEDGAPLDKNYSTSDFARAAVESARKDLDDFMAAADPLVDQTDLTPSDAAHNFWLTRNGHGAGFWDLGLGKVGDELTKIAKQYGGSDVYLGDDGQLYLS